MKKFLLFCLLLPLSVFSQALSGSYTIGTGQPFPFNTLTNAVNRINTSGVTGPVIFLLDNTTYNNISGESFPIRITNFSGSSAVNTLTIRPNINRTVTIAASPGPLNYIGVPAA